MKRKLSLLLTLIFLMSSFTVFATETIAENFTNQEIVKEVAYAYFRKGVNIHYDQATATARREINLSPEEATSQRRAYLDCSGYARAVYNEAFGLEILPEAATVKRPSTVNIYAYAAANPSNPDVIGSWEIDSTTNKETLKNEIRESLVMGDVFTLRYDKNNDGSIDSGHTIIYVGENEKGDKVFLHCYGGQSYVVNSTDAKLSYDTQVLEETEPSIAELKLEDLLTNPEENYYLFRTTNPIKQICILRPLAKNTSIEPTEETKSRMLIKGLSMGKTSNPHSHTAVFTGDSITYTVTLKNTTDAPITASITDSVPAGTTFKEGDSGVVHNAGAISWSGSVPAQSECRVNYTVTVTATTSTIITSDAAEVSGVKLGAIKHTLSLLTKKQINLLVDTAKKYVSDETAISKKMELAKTLYNEALGVVFTTETGLSNFLNTFVSTSSYTSKSNPILVPDLFGGTSVVNSREPLDVFDTRARLITVDDLSAGDCIYAIKGSAATVYMYLGENEFVTLDANGGAMRKVTPAQNIYAPNQDNVLISLFGHEKFVVFRPSMYYSSNVVPEDGSDEPDVPTLPDEPEEETAINVSTALSTAVDEGVTVKGYFVGVTREGPSAENDEELLIKDIETNDIIAVRTASSEADFPNVSRQKGDLVVVKGTIKNDTDSSNVYNQKKYLLMSKTGSKWDWEVKSQGNSIKYDFSSVITVSSQDEIISLLTNNKIKPYTYVKFEGTTYSNLTVSNNASYIAPATYRLHKNGAATQKGDFLYNAERAFSFSRQIMEMNLGSNWGSLFYDDVTASNVKDQIPGATISKTFYALYTGGNKYYAQLVVLDESWIMDECKIIEVSGNTITAETNKEGTYNFVVADYNGNKLENVEIITKTLKPGIAKFERTKDFAISKDDKVIMINGFAKLNPLGSAYIIK